MWKLRSVQARKSSLRLITMDRSSSGAQDISSSACVCAGHICTHAVCAFSCASPRFLSISFFSGTVVTPVLLSKVCRQSPPSPRGRPVCSNWLCARFHIFAVCYKWQPSFLNLEYTAAWKSCICGNVKCLIVFSQTFWNVYLQGTLSSSFSCPPPTLPMYPWHFYHSDANCTDKEDSNGKQ